MDVFIIFYFVLYIKICYYVLVAVKVRRIYMLKGKDTKFVMLFFAVISLIMIYLMINNFKIIDCCYFFIVVGFATKYFILSRD